MFQRFLVIAIISVASMTARASSVTAALRVTPESILPGLPVSFIVELRNPSGVDVSMQTFVRLQVQPDVGEEFFAHSGTYDVDGFAMGPLPHSASERYAVPANGSIELSAPMDSTLAGPEFQWDPRLNRPGKYSVRILMYQDDEQRSIVATNWTTFRIETPQGVDAEAWGLFRAVSENWNLQHWMNAGGAVAATIVERYPTSGYYPYALLLAPTSDWIERAEAVLRNRTDAPVYDHLKITLAATHDAAQSKAFWQGRFDLAEAEARESLRWINDVIANTKYSFVREAAKEYAATLPEPKNLRGLYEYHKEQMGSAIELLTPFVQCVDRSGDEIVTRFGYVNPNKAGKWIEIGSRHNAVSPGPADQGQPGYFQSGRQEWVFGAIGTKGKVPVWTLDGTSTSAGKDLPACTSLPRSAVRPIVECVRTTNESAVVFFGYDNPNRFPVTIPFGDANRFDSRLDLGQPQVFRTGRQKSVFHVPVKTAPVSWTLDGQTVIATRGILAECPR